MSILHLLARRPWVRFDPSDINHRSYYLEFLQKKGWMQCPVRFYLERGYSDLTSMIEDKLATYYLAQEFHTQVRDRSRHFDPF